MPGFYPILYLHILDTQVQDLLCSMNVLGLVKFAGSSGQPGLAPLRLGTMT